jgi:Flp pilus assembly CpaE family ATPase
MSAMSPVRPWFVAKLACDPVIAGSVQPMTHATTAIHRETATAVAALTICQVKCILTCTIHLLQLPDTLPFQRRINSSQAGNFTQASRKISMVAAKNDVGAAKK